MYQGSLSRKSKQAGKERSLSLIEACLIGLVAALGAVFLKNGVGWLGTLRVHEVYEFPLWYTLPAIGLTGGLTAGLIVQLGARDAQGGGVAQVKAALSGFKAPLNLRITLTKLVSCIVTLGSGFALGRQGPTVYIGAGLAATMSRLLSASPMHRRQLIAAGAGAGMAAAFNAPLAGVLMVLEQLLRDISGLAVGTAVVSCFVGAVVSRLLGVQSLDIEFANIAHRASFSAPDIPFYVLLGCAAGVLGALFNKGVITSLTVNKSILRIGIPGRMALAGLITGVILTFLPAIFRNHAGLREMLVTGEANLNLATTAFLAHYLLTLIACGSGAPGGLLAPSLTLGASLGFIVGTLEHALIGIGVPSTFALVGMGSFFGAVSRVPITAIVLVFEMTTDFNLVLPLMISSVIATAVAERLQAGSVFDEILRWQGIDLEEESTGQKILTRLKAKDFMHQEVETLPADMKVDDAVQQFLKSRHRGFPVVENNRLVGIVSQTDLSNMDKDRVKGDDPISKIMTPRPVAAKSFDALSDILIMLNKHQVSRLPVLEGKKLVGIITRSDIIRAESEELTMEAERLPEETERSYVVYQTRSPAVGWGRILVPVSNPVTAEPHLRLAAAIAQKFEYELECLQVISVPESMDPSEAKVTTSQSRIMVSKAEEIGREVKVPVHTQVRISRNVSQAILETISDRSIDIVLLGWGGKSAKRGPGTVMNDIIRKAPCSVMLVNDFPKSGHLERWLIPTGAFLDEQQAVRMIPALVSMSKDPKISVCQIFSKEDKEGGETKALKRTTKLLEHELKLKVTPFSVCAESMSDVLVDLANKDQCDAVVLGTSHKKLLDQMMKDNIPEVVARDSDCTVIIIRESLPTDA